MTRQEHLLRLLQAHQPTDPAELAFVERMLGLLEVASGPIDGGPVMGDPVMGDPFSRDHFVPGHFTASAFILSPQEDALLLVFHGKLHRWLQPGGHVDPEDTDIIAAASREILEEVGISEISLAYDGIFDVDIHDIPPIKQEPAHAHFDVRFLFRAHHDHFAAGSDAKDARWWPLSEITLQHSDRSVTRALAKIHG